MKPFPASTLFGEVLVKPVFSMTACSLPLLSIAPPAYAPETIGLGLVTVDIATSTLRLETRSGCQRVFVAPAVAIRAAHGRALALDHMQPVGAVANPGVSDPARSNTTRRER